MKIQDFYKHLKNNLDDWEYRSIFADWLFDHNYSELEKAQRWMIKQKKHPCPWKETRIDKVLYLWGKKSNLAFETVKCFWRCMIEDEIAEKISQSKHWQTYNITNWRYFWKLRDAEEALGKVLHENTRFLQTLEKQS